MYGVRRVASAAVVIVACGPAAGDSGDAGSGSGPGEDAGRGDAGAGAVDAESGASADAVAGDGVSYADAYFAATHNSYSGDIGGERGPLRAQLEAGVRGVELDIHDDDFGDHGYRVGHNSPGGEVDDGGDNPDTHALEAWLGVIASWSDENPDHAPITLLVDLKDDLDQNESYADGDPARLNEVLIEAFGDRLVRAEDVGSAFPSVRELRGMIVAVMSGSESTRVHYRRDPGHNVAVAVDDGGRVIEVHDSGGGDLWYWTGEIEGDRIRWHRHAQYDTGEDPAIALNNDGLVVEVHNAEDGITSDDRLFYRVGELRDDFEIEWHHDQGIQFPDGDNGIDPTVRFVDRDGFEVREIHRSENNPDNHFYWDGVFDPEEQVIEWTRQGDGGETDEPLHDKSRDETAGYAAEVTTGPYLEYGDDTLLYRVGDGAWRPIRYEQVLFVEAQHGGASALEADDGLWFYAADARSESGRDWAYSKRRGGGVTRLWMLNTPEHRIREPVNFPATDYPGADWYQTHCDELGCRE